MYEAKRKGSARYELFQDGPPDLGPDGSASAPGATEAAATSRGAGGAGIRAGGAGTRAGAQETPALPDEELAMREIAEEISIEEPLIAERTDDDGTLPRPSRRPPAEHERPDETPPVAAEPPERSDTDSDEGTASLTEARRRRRRRFPPRR